MATAELIRVTRSETAEKYGISESDLDELELSGVKLPEDPVEIGRGLTRIVYRAKYERGERKMDVAVKVPHEVSPEDSIIGYINTTRRDVNRREVDIHNLIEGHNRIISILGTVETEDERTICFEPFKDKAMSLEEKVKYHNGKIRDEEGAVDFIEKLIDPFLYLHKYDVNVLHRDVKPSNILMTREGPVLTDFQNATIDEWNYDCSAQPTRGGTRYTRYTLINELLRGEETRYTKEDEVHSIAATILYALTGNDPFDYKLRGVEVDRDYQPKEKETVIPVNGKRFLIKLSSEGRDLEEITAEENTRRVKEAISGILDSKLRKKYGSLLERALIPEHKKAIKDVYAFRDEFDRIRTSGYLKAKERIVEGLRWVPGVAVGAAITGFMIGGLKYLGNRDMNSPPTVSEMLRREEYTKYSLIDLSEEERAFVYPLLVPYMKKAEKFLPEIENSKIKSRGEVEINTRFAHDIHRMPKRLVSSWLRACYLNRNLIERYGDKFDEKRLAPCFVPESFMIRNLGRTYRPTDTENEGCVNAQGTMYLKLCLGPNQTVEDTFAEYFSTRLDQSASMAKTGSSTYLPRVHKDGKIDVGFQKFLPGHQRELVNSALALYLITDEEGEIHYDWILEITPPYGIASSLERSFIVKDIGPREGLVNQSIKSIRYAHEKRTLIDIGIYNPGSKKVSYGCNEKTPVGIR